MKRYSIFLACLASFIAQQVSGQGEWIRKNPAQFDHGAIIRGDTTRKKIALVFTGDEFADGGNIIAKTLKSEKIKASFFFTGRFYRNPTVNQLIQKLKNNGHYLGPHSDQHLLYCDWKNRDSLLVTKNEFSSDIDNNLSAMKSLGINSHTANGIYFIPPYEWWNDSIAAWSKEKKLKLFNFSPGTISHADYTFPGLTNYRNSDEIYQSIVNYENTHGMNGFILLLHIGTDPKRTDKFYMKLPAMLKYFKGKKYQLVTIDKLLE